jgi:hypothetical protein
LGLGKVHSRVHKKTSERDCKDPPLVKLITIFSLRGLAEIC